MMSYPPGPVTPAELAERLIDVPDSYALACKVLQLGQSFACSFCGSHQCYVYLTGHAKLRLGDWHFAYGCKPCWDEAAGELWETHVLTDIELPGRNRLVVPSNHWRLEMPDGTVTPWEKL